MDFADINFTHLVKAYPRRDKKDDRYKYVDSIMKTLPGTPCCIQMSQALNGCLILIPNKTYRRTPLPRITEGGLTYYFIPAVDELEVFMTEKFGKPETVGTDGSRPRSMSEIKSYLGNKQGLLIFRQGPYRQVGPPGMFEHTELWDGSQIVQRDMNEGYLFGCKRVLFWRSGYTPEWLETTMAQNR